MYRNTQVRYVRIHEYVTVRTPRCREFPIYISNRVKKGGAKHHDWNAIPTIITLSLCSYFFSRTKQMFSILVFCAAVYLLGQIPIIIYSNKNSSSSSSSSSSKVSWTAWPVIWQTFLWLLWVEVFFPGLVLFLQLFWRRYRQVDPLVLCIELTRRAQVETCGVIGLQASIVTLSSAQLSTT